jgi:release factor glutamine methyltransferase
VTQPAPIGIAAVAARLRAAGCVFAEDEANLLSSAARTPSELNAMVDRRVSGVPLEQVVGWAEFCGLRIVLTPGVFVPRRRSEFLVRQAVAVARAHRGRQDAVPARRPGTGEAVPRVVLDLCCGSGAVGVAVATALGAAELHASDIDAVAVACARTNLASVGGQGYLGDLYEPLPHALAGRVDVLVVNAPYVPTSEMALMPAEARLHEPAVALDGGSDGVDIHRRVAAQAAAWLAPGGHLVIETTNRQARLTAAAVTASGLIPRVASDDDLAATVVIGVSAPAPRGS